MLGRDNPFPKCFRFFGHPSLAFFGSRLCERQTKFLATKRASLIGLRFFFRGDKGAISEFFRREKSWFLWIESGSEKPWLWNPWKTRQPCFQSNAKMFPLDTIVLHRLFVRKQIMKKCIKIGPFFSSWSTKMRFSEHSNNSCTIFLTLISWNARNTTHFLKKKKEEREMIAFMLNSGN
jgi:hypothetical protein